MTLYHASKFPMCHRDGIKHNVKKTCCNFDDGFVYLADIEYLEEQYFQYCPKGIYYIFKVDFHESDGRIEYLDRVHHYRYRGYIEPKFVEPLDVKVVK